MNKVTDEELKKKIKEELQKGNVVVINPKASKIISGKKVKPINYPR